MILKDCQIKLSLFSFSLVFPFGFFTPTLFVSFFFLCDVNTSRTSVLLNHFLTHESLVDYFLYAKATWSEISTESGSSMLTEVL